MDELTVLRFAREGAMQALRQIEARIRELDATLKPPKAQHGGKRILSAAARKRISEAQKKRWAVHRGKKAAA